MISKAIIVTSGLKGFSICNVIEDEVNLISASAHNVQLRRDFFSIVATLYPQFIFLNSVSRKTSILDAS